MDHFQNSGCHEIFLFKFRGANMYHLITSKLQFMTFCTEYLIVLDILMLFFVKCMLIFLLFIILNLCKGFETKLLLSFFVEVSVL